MKEKENEVSSTVDEIQKIMDMMEKRTMNGMTSMEWEGSIQNAPTKHTENDKESRN